MPVVSDADVLIHLSKLGKLSLLRSLFKEVAVPEYVESEILTKADAGLQEALHSFLKVLSTPKEKASGLAKKHHIHIGEAHVKVLGEELKAILFLSNERRVREAAKEEGFVVAGTASFLKQRRAD